MTSVATRREIHHCCGPELRNGPAQTLQAAGMIESARLGRRGKGALSFQLPYSARVLTVLSFSFRQRVIS